jgi:hypothetical protein
MKRLATQMVLGLSVVFAGLAISGSASAQTFGRWQNANQANGTFYLGVAGGCVSKGPGFECGMKPGQQIITYQLAGFDQQMSAFTDGTVTQIKDTYPDYMDLTTPTCVGVANNVKSLNAGLVIWDCQTPSQGPGQYWIAKTAESLGAPYSGCFVFVNQNSSAGQPASKPIVMSVQSGVVKNGSAVVQYTLCSPTNGACGNPSNQWHPDQFWCPAP